MKKVVTCLLVWLLAGRGIAEATPVPPASAPSRAPRALSEPGTDVVLLPPDPVGACVGGDCRSPAARRGVVLPQPRRTARGAHGAAVFGLVSAGLLLGGAIGIAAADHLESERVTRGLWLGTMVLAPPIVGLTAYLARRGRAVQGVRSARRLGWTAYSAAVTNGVLQWYGAFHAERSPVLLTVSGGFFGVLCLLPLAFDALVSARSARTSAPQARFVPGISGMGVRF